MKAKSLIPALISILLICFSLNSFALPIEKGGLKDSDSVKRKHGLSFGGLGFFAPGIHTIQYSKIGEFLPAAYPAITNKPFMTGGVGYGIIGNIIVGGAGGTMHAGTFIKDNRQVELTGGYGFFTLGYLLVNRKGFLIYPLVAIGGNDLQMYIHQTGQTSGFNGVVTNPYQATTIRNHEKMLRFSLSGLFAPQSFKSDGGANGLMIGFEAGYQMGYGSDPWTYDNGDIVDRIGFGNNSFFIQLLIGGGGVMKR